MEPGAVSNRTTSASPWEQQGEALCFGRAPQQRCAWPPKASVAGTVSLRLRVWEHDARPKLAAGGISV